MNFVVILGRNDDVRLALRSMEKVDTGCARQGHEAVLADVYRDAIPDPMDITKFQWRTILAFMGASEEEIRDVQLRMGRVWR